jgi:glycosyltransferase involved in cell wall biosynthesis
VNLYSETLGSQVTLRVALLSPSVYPVIGGTERYLDTLSTSLREHNVTSEIIALCDTKKWNGTLHLKKKTVNGTDVLVWPSHRYSVLNRATARLFRAHFIPAQISCLEEHLKSFDLIHYHDEVDLSFPISLRNVRKEKLLTFHTLSGVLPSYRSNPLARRMLTKSANLFQTFLEDDAGLLVELGINAQNIRVVPHGVDVRNFRFPNRKTLEPCVRIACICRIDRVKGLIHLLAAARILKQRFSPGSFEVRIVAPVNDASYYHELLEYKERMHLDEVRFLGPLSHEDRGIASFLEQSSIFVLPSLYEEFPVVNLEAMASGLPIVATRVGANPEVIVDGETGFIVPPGDPEELADGLAKLIDAPELRRKMGRNGRKRVETSFAIEKTTPMIVDIYQEMLRASSSKEH